MCQSPVPRFSGGPTMLCHGRTLSLQSGRRFLHVYVCSQVLQRTTVCVKKKFYKTFCDVTCEVICGSWVKAKHLGMKQE